MTTIKTTTVKLPATGFAATMTQWTTRAFNTVVKFFVVRRNRTAILRLGDLDDYMLKDIGVSRSDLHRVLGRPYLDDPSSELRVIVEARARQQAARGIF
ncbi:hypothetical protein ATN84_02240 [Paramesorhizobium deserti]|uniref:YjiS-like domain-containing protein n=1 Tax=Paramesorhizobium deserti TaxID=1494590 RepID=A0A135HZM1_9HYPH|nr:DUF1127 domain-containing protein [Paramesorhizobium deserti]KXF78629.1 hypothetical protein ATN84_02240 [Paramesorhizobium deserti]